MIVTSEQLDIEIPASKTPRSQGVHVSSIIRCIATERGVLKPEWAEEIAELSLSDQRTIKDPVAKLRICMGLAFEEWYIPQLKGVKDHPGEFKVDDVYLSPDGESLSVIFTQGKVNRRLKVIEVKVTYKSLNTVGNLDLTPKNFMWLSQMMSYCKARNTLEADLHVLFVCGDYQKPITPQLWVYHVIFTPEEIEENWSLMRDYKTYKLQEKD